MKYDAAALLEIRDSYRADTRAFLRFLHARHLDMSIPSLEEYAEHLRNSGYAAQTINKRITGAKKVLRRVFTQSDEARDVLAAYQFEQRLREIRKSKLNTKEVPDDKLLTADEVKRIVEDASVPERVRLIIRTFSISGLRVSELCNIRLADVKASARHYAVRIRGKGDKERWIQLPKELVAELRRVFNGREYLFETAEHSRYDRHNVSRSINAAGRRLLGKNVTAHTLRHTFATHLIRKGMTVKAVSKYIGHSGTAITQDMYVHDSLELDDIIGSM